jgi:IclR family transcriptional regulator, KDG regulon repressor
MAVRGTSLRRGLQILIALGSDTALAEGGLGVSGIAECTGHEKSQVSRTLAVLSEHRLVERSPVDRTYRLGWGWFMLAARAGEPRLLQDARPALAQLVATAGEAAHLSTLEGTEVLTLLTHAPGHAIVAQGWVGRRVPAYCTSSGRALLFDHDRAALAELLGAEPFAPLGPNAPADVRELERRILRAREAGYAVADEESELGLVAVAAPIRDFTGRVVAAVNVSAPKFRLGQALHQTGEMVRATAEQLSEALGAPGKAGPDAIRQALANELGPGEGRSPAPAAASSAPPSGSLPASGASNVGAAHPLQVTRTIVHR